MRRSRYYNPFRAWYQRRLYGPVNWTWTHVPMPTRLMDRLAGWTYIASGAGRRSTRKEAARRRTLMASLPVTPREFFTNRAAPSGSPENDATDAL